MQPATVLYRVRYANGDRHKISAREIGDVLEASRIIREREGCTCDPLDECGSTGLHSNRCRMSPKASPALKTEHATFMLIDSIRRLTTVILDGKTREIVAE